MNKRFQRLLMLATFSTVIFGSAVPFGSTVAWAESARGAARGKLTSNILPETSTVIDMVVAAIDGEPVTMADLKHFIAGQGNPLPEDLQSGGKEVRKFLRELIVARLFEKEAEKSGITVSDEDISAYIAEIKKQNSVDDAGLEKMLMSKGLSLDEYKSQVKSDIVKTRVLAAEVRSKVNVSDEDIGRYLESHPDLAPSNDTDGTPEVSKAGVHVEQIAIRFGEGLMSRDQALEHVNEIRNELGKGGNWSELGGASFTDLGFVSTDDLLPELKSTVDKLDVGDMSEVIETANGFYVIKSLEKKAAEEPKPDTKVAAPAISEELKKQIKEQLFQERAKDKFNEFVNDTLPTKYNVELKL